MMSEVRRASQEVQTLEMELKSYNPTQHAFTTPPQSPRVDREEDSQGDGLSPPSRKKKDQQTLPELMRSWQQRAETRGSPFLLEALWKAGVGQTQQPL